MTVLTKHQLTRFRFSVDDYEKMIKHGILDENDSVELIRGEVLIKDQNRPYLFSVDEYEQMIMYGMLDENDRVELIEGEVLNKMTIGDRHAASLKRLNRLFSRLVDLRALIGIQDPVRLTYSRPEPDLSLLHLRDDCYESRAPSPVEVFLLIEVADSSLEFDREVKGSSYANAGIPEYWIVNLIDDSIEVYRQPRPDGTWGDMRVLRRGERAEVAALPGVSIAVDEVL